MIAIIYGALVAMVQWDIKKLVAYSSVSHMGFVMLGLASMTVIGTQGAMLQMLNHGISTGALFLMVGMLYDRAHTRMIADFGGVAAKMPIFTTFFLIVTLSSIGLPLTNGFVGEFLILNGTFVAGFDWGRPLAILATLGVRAGRRLHAVDGEAGLLGPREPGRGQRHRPPPRGPECPRDRRAGAHRRADLLDGPASHRPSWPTPRRPWSSS